MVGLLIQVMYSTGQEKNNFFLISFSFNLCLYLVSLILKFALSIQESVHLTENLSAPLYNKKRTVIRQGP